MAGENVRICVAGVEVVEPSDAVRIPVRRSVKPRLSVEPQGIMKFFMLPVSLQMLFNTFWTVVSVMLAVVAVVSILAVGVRNAAGTCKTDPPAVLIHVAKPLVR